MSTNFPTAKDAPKNNWTNSDQTVDTLASELNNDADAILALQDKVGIDSSADTSSLDYKVSNTASIEPGHKHNLSSLNDVNDAAKADGFFVSWDQTSGEHIYSSTTAPDASTTVKGVSKMSVAPALSTDPIAVGDNDTRVPSQDENDALGNPTSGGSLSSSNPVVDSDDVTEAKTASKIVRRDSNSDVLVATTPTNADAATSKTYVDAHKTGVTTRDMTAASGAQTIAHGLGQTPTKVRLKGILLDSGTEVCVSEGVWTSGSTSYIYYVLDSVNQGVATSSSATIKLNDPSAVFGSWTQTGVVTVDGTNITITWTKSGSPTGTGYIMWEAN